MISKKEKKICLDAMILHHCDLMLKKPRSKCEHALCKKKSFIITILIIRTARQNCKQNGHESNGREAVKMERTDGEVGQEVLGLCAFQRSRED